MDVNIDQSLFESVLNEDYKETLFLLSIGADPNRLFKEHNGISTFHIAVGLEDDLKFTRLFIKNNANVNIKSSKDNWTPLHVCAYWNKHESLQLLLLNQADPFILDKNGKSPLDIANEHKSTDCIRLLNEYIEKIKLKNSTRTFNNKSNKQRNFFESTNNKLSLSSSSNSETSIISLDESDPNRSYSNIKTSTFDESNLEYYLANPTTNTKRTTPPKLNINLQNLNKKNNLESLISNLIDIKLEKREKLKNLDNISSNIRTPESTIQKTITISNSPLSIHKSRTITPSNKSTASTQTKITNQRFLSPDRLPAYHSPKIIHSNLSTPTGSIKNTPQCPPPPPPLPPPILNKQTGLNQSPSVNRETQTTGRLIKLKNAVPCVPPDLIEELNSKFKSKLTLNNNQNEDKLTIANITPNKAEQTKNNSNKIKNWFNNKFHHNVKQENKLLNSETKLRSTSVTSLIKKNPIQNIQSKLTQTNSKDSKILRKRSCSLISSNRSHKENELYSNAEVVKKVNLLNYNNNKDFDYEGPIQTINTRFVTERACYSPNKFVKCENLNYRFNDNNTLITNDLDSTLNDVDLSKKTTSTYRTANENVNDYMSLTDVEFDFQNLSNLNKTEIKYYESLGYSNELIEELVNRMNISTQSDVIESNMFKCFQQNLEGSNSPKVEWREGNVKSAFNYLLIDPRITENLPKRAKYLSEKDVFRIFISSIFYIGKGSRARPYAHLYDTLRLWKNMQNFKTKLINYDNSKPVKMSKKIQRIIDIWENNKGVVSLHCFQSVIPSEAYTREAAMIDALGMNQLTNMKKGNYYGESKDWEQKRKQQLGVILLRRACAIFLAEGERQITPADI